MNRVHWGFLLTLLALLFCLTACGGAASDVSGESSSENQTAEAGPAAPDFSAVESGGVAGDFPAFSAKTMEGGEINNAVFADAKLTMINIWATYCGPCIEEMPELGKMAKDMPTGSQLLGLVIDYEGNEELAVQILSQSAAEFPQLIPDAGLMEYLYTVTAVPTTVFVDDQGNVVGDPVVGMQSEAQYRAEIEKRMAAGDA